MKQSTKLLSLVLALVMAFSCMTVIGNAALVKSEVTWDNNDDAQLTPPIFRLFLRFICAFFTIDCVKYFNFTVFCLYLALFFLIETWFYAVWEFLLIMIKKLIKYGVKLFRFTLSFVKSLCIFLFWLYICSFWRMENMQ